VTATSWLIDKSAITRLATSPDSPKWLERIERGLVHISTVTLLEIGYSTRSALDHRRTLSSPPIGDMPVEYCTPTIEDRAVDVQAQLARQGRHRGPSVADLIIAATAELSRRTILHIDKDFDLIAAVSQQPVEQLRV
jgi:predicted nucleic acid-binding protein